MSIDEPTGRDLRVMWGTVVVVAVVVASCAGGVLYVATEWVRLVTRLEAVEKWQAQKDREASRELWRRERVPQSIGPGVQR